MYYTASIVAKQEVYIARNASQNAAGSVAVLQAENFFEVRKAYSTPAAPT